MNRQQFLEQIGMGIAGTFLITCLGSCSKSNPSSPVQSVDFTLNLTDTAAAPLLNAGGYIYTNGVIVAKTQSGTYILQFLNIVHTRVILLITVITSFIALRMVRYFQQRVQCYKALRDRL